MRILHLLLFVFGLSICISTNCWSQTLFINEVLASNNNSIPDEVGELEDWIEIYNPTANSIDLADYYLSDDALEPLQWQIPATNSALTTVPANGYLILWADNDTEQGENHLGFKLGSGGEDVLLVAPDGVTIIDQFTYPALLADQSYGRINDGEVDFTIFGKPSPSASNNGSLTAIQNPIISPTSGQYNAAQTITITSATPEADIYYTIDGSKPSATSLLYSTPFVVDSTQSVRAIAIQTGFLNSKVVTESYIFYDTDLPIISITTDPDNLWGDSLGIYTVGTNGVSGCGLAPANYWQEDWERPANIVMIESDGTLAFQTDAGIEMSGGCSRIEPQKSLNLKARSSYGASHFEHQVFPDYEQNEYKRLKLRNGGSNFKLLHLRESLNQSLVLGEVDIDQQRSRASVVFLNGEYWGIMYLIDSKGKNWIDENHNIEDKDALDIIEPSALSNYANVIDGSGNDYSALFDFIEFNSLSITENYDYVASKIDITEYINYQIFQIYIQNTDWPGNNVRIWKEQKTDAKFRWIVFDTDFGTGHSRNFSDLSRAADHTTNTLEYATDSTMNTNTSNFHSTLFLRKLLENTAFKNEFIQRFATQMNTLFTTNRMQTKALAKYQEVLNEIPAHFSRWNGSSYDGGIYSDIATLTMSAWQTEFDYIAQEWMVERPAYMNRHLLDFFDIENTYTLNIPIAETSNGRVVLNQNEYLAPFNYSGTYYTNIPMRLRAIPNVGYRFSHWLETGATDHIQIFTSVIDTTFTPVFVPDTDIVFNEIHYNPDNEDDEFVELYNPSTYAKDISGYTFSEGFCLTFPDNTILDSNSYLIITNNPAAYANNNIPVFQIEQGSISNGGEELILQNSIGNTIDSLEYDDKSPWDETPDDGLFSLALLDYTLDNSLASSWVIQSSAIVTAGAANDFTVIYDCTNLNVNIGDQCDDLDECTENDAIDANCICAGTLIDANMNGICDVELDCTATQYPYNCEQRLIPGIIEAEAYDEGGEGIAYHDDEIRFGDPNYRPDDNVDVIGGIIGWTKDGEWLEYTLSATEGIYTIKVTAASGSSNPGSLDLSIDGVFLTNIDIQSTGGYGTYDTFTVSNVFIPSGELQVLRSSIIGSGFNTDRIEFIQKSAVCEGLACNDLDVCTENDVFDANCNCLGTLIDSNMNGLCDIEEPACSGEQYPFDCDTMLIPGIVQVEFYDEGGEGIAFHDDDTRFGNPDYRSGDNVDVLSTGIGWIKTGEWLEYTLNVTEGIYTINVHAASGSNNPVGFDLSINNTYLTNIDIQSTGGYGIYNTFAINNVFIEGGEAQVLRLDMLGGGFNLDQIEFVLETATCEGLACDDLDECTDNDIFDVNCNCLGTLIDTNMNGLCDIEEPACSGEQYPFDCDTMLIPGIVQAEFYDEGGEGIAFHDDDTRFGNLDYRPDDNVDVLSTGIGWIKTGEWLEYTLDVTQGIYTINIVVASGSSNPGSIDFLIDNNLLGNIDIQNTGGYGSTNNSIFSISDISITGGDARVLRLNMLGGGFNLDYIEFVPLLLASAPTMLNASDSQPLQKKDKDIINKEQKTPQLSLSPNPVQNVLSVQITNLVEIANLEIFNNMGHLVHSLTLDKEIPNVVIPLGELATGVYLIRLQTTGNHYTTKRFVKTD